MDGNRLGDTPSSEVLTALDRCAAAGPFFVIEHGPPLEPDLGAAPSRERDSSLVSASPDRTGVAFTSPSQLAEAIEAVRGWLGGEVHARVAASLFFMSYTGRVLSVALGGVLAGGVLLDVSSVTWRYVPGAGVALRVARPHGWSGDREALLSAFGARVVGDHLGAMVAALRELVPVSGRLLWGNAASSLAGALGALAASGLVRPDECRAVGERLLALPPLSEHPGGRFNGGFIGDPTEVLRFRRDTCCLYYRVTVGALCGDCVLRR